MSSFAESFWSVDYAAGLGVLFDKLQQGCQENQQVLAIARTRADAEELYSQRLADITPITKRIGGGFERDDGASVRKAYEGVRIEMDEAAKNHSKIASNIRELVVNPFSRWCDQHASRVQAAQDDLQIRIRAHDRQADNVRKLRGQYYNKCRLLEDLQEEDKLAFQDPQAEPTSPRSQKTKGKAPQLPEIKEPEPTDEELEPIEIGDREYSPEEVKKIMAHVLATVPLGETKVPFLGVYQNVTSGADITEYIQTHMGTTNLAATEKVGQDLADNGFLRLVGNVGNTFANSSRFNYQWKSKAFQMAGIPEKKAQPGQMNRVMSLGMRTMTGMGVSSEGLDDTPVGAVSEYLSGWNPLNNPYPNESPSEKLKREAKESDERYQAGVSKLDTLRCQLEETMIDRLKWMERCELDRLKAIKSVILDFSGAISNVIPSLQSTVDKMMLFQETIQPNRDLKFLLENYKTGNFVPKVLVYENYYNNIGDQTFGVDLEARARADRKRVPLIVSSLLTCLDSRYPDLEGDEVRRAVWITEVPLAKSHELRSEINNGKAIAQDVLEKYEVHVIASVLKLYLLELPDSVVSSSVYEIVKTIYSTPATDSSETARIQVLQNTLGTLHLSNIATLDSITTHFALFIELTSANETYITAIATTLAQCILRPKQETSISMSERYAYRLVRDLLQHREAIFGELKRASSLKAREQANTTTRGRGTSIITNDESGKSRKQLELERNQAVAARVRGTSPTPPTSRNIKRERSPHRGSIGGAETRFPVAVHGSPTEGGRRATVTRQSLEVPGNHQESLSSALVEGQQANGTSGTRHVVELTDKPMDD